MSETEWPSGPWTVRRAGFTTDGEYDYGISAVIDGKSYCIAEAFGRVAPTVRPPAEATAHLIRAAPELYDALLETMSILQFEFGPVEDVDNKDKWSDVDAFAAFQEASTAMAKARGET